MNGDNNNVEHDAAIHDAAKSVHRRLYSFRIADVIDHRHLRQPPRELISVAAESSLGDVLSIMHQNDIVACPVFHWSADQRKDFIGIVSVDDILAFTVFNNLFDLMDVDVEGVGNDQKQFIKWISVDSEMKKYFKTSVADLVGKTAESAVTWILRASDTVESLLQSFFKLHRILILDDAAVVASAITDDESSVSCVTMLTQTDVLRWLIDNRDIIAPHEMTTLLNATVDDVTRRVMEGGGAVEDLNQVAPRHVKRQKVVTVPDDFTAIQAFRVMYMHRVKAVAVVNHEGSLVATLSSSDLRGITGDSDSLGALLRPVFEFLETRRRPVDRVRADQLRVSERPDKVWSAAKQMLDSRVHRLWIMGTEDKPTGVVSLGDVLRFFVPVEEVCVDL